MKDLLANSSLSNRLLGRRRSKYFLGFMSLGLVALPLIAISLDGKWRDMLTSGYLRPVFMPVVLIAYFLILAPIMARQDMLVLAAIRPVVLVEEAIFESVVRKASRIHPAGEILSMAVGGAFGFFYSQGWAEEFESFWLDMYVKVAMTVLFLLLFWTIYCALASTRLNAALHRQPMKVDIFDRHQFEPIGRQSLIAALAFIGGITLSMFFSLDLESIFYWQTWLFYVPLALVPVMVFFLNMRYTHTVLAKEKRNLLSKVHKEIDRANRIIQKNLVDGKSVDQVSGHYQTLVTYEDQVRLIPTWPYNTSMMRTLGFTIVLPLIVRGLSVLLFGN